MTVWICCALYAAGLVTIAGCVVRAWMYARAPLHLRWEVYPVPEGAAGQARFMATEILFLHGLWEYNRSLWWRSFPFHFGLYLLIATGALVSAGAITGVAALHYVYVITGTAGAILVLIGASGLLLRRLTDPALRPYTTAGDIFNLGIFLAVVLLLAAGYVSRAPGDPGARAFVRAVLTFDTSFVFPPLLATGTVLAALLAAYIPMTHMSHFIAKYFTYHAVRWDDAPNPRGGAIERRMAEYLTYRPTWRAPHVGADGAKDWLAVATSLPATSRPATGGKA
jgi:nitrate reductase gamma subunit